MVSKVEEIAMGLAGLVLATVLLGQAAAAQVGPGGAFYPRNVWDLKLGSHGKELSNEFAHFACGTNGGPPSLLLNGWHDYARCEPEPDTGFHEIYFEYDDEPLYWARARNHTDQAVAYEFTRVFSIPVIASALFDDEGFLVGIRIVTDDRAPAELRERGPELGTFIAARYDEVGWNCIALPRIEGEREYRGGFIKQKCRKSQDDMELLVEVHHYRKPGQFAIDPVSKLPTTGQFEASTRFQVHLADFEASPERIAALQEIPPTEKELLIERARDCPGCDFENANFKRADLSGANLAGANLAGVNLHGAKLAGANLANADLTEANLNRMDAKRANFRGAKLGEAMMYETRFDGADFTGADLTGAYAGKVQFIHAILRDAILLEVDLRGARLGWADFTGADLSGSWLHESKLDRADLSGTKSTFVVLWYASMVRANLTGANFQSADLYGANLRGANLSTTDFTHARLTQANLHEATLVGTMWPKVEDLPAGFEPPR